MTGEVIKRRLLDVAPRNVKDLVVTVRGSAMLRERRRGVYDERRRRYSEYRALGRRELEEIQTARLEALVDRASKLSPFYRERLRDWSGNLSDVPFLEKTELRKFVSDITIGDRRKLRPSYTGGTSGAGIVVYNSLASLQERTALLDEFWSTHGVEFGSQRVAWFSGRHLVGKNDVAARCFWRNNFRWRIRYYSTFHMDPAHLPAYAADINRFRPECLSGFPSAIGELARFIRSEGLRLTFRPRVVFSTSETLTEELRATIEEVFDCPVRNQYASSEGAPWISECPHGRLHLDITTGVFEVLDGGDEAAEVGDLVVTSFLTQETPLIRYRIGDRVRLAGAELCACGWEAPLVRSIEGRSSDFITVAGRGRVFAAQIGDCAKSVTSMHAFRVGLNEAGEVDVEVVADRGAFEGRHRELFVANLRERVGEIPIVIRHVDSIPRLPSGKHSVIRS